MDSIIIVEALSTGINYIKDIADRGFYPIVLETAPCGIAEIDRFQAKRRAISYQKTNTPFDIIKASESYEDTVRMIKKINPAFIIPGTECGVELATRLSTDLGLKGNSYSNIGKMTRKDCMHDALKNAGIRYIKGKLVSTVDEAVQFYNELGGKDIVVKHPRGASSKGVHICHGKEDMISALKAELNNLNLYGEVQSKILLQELIVGQEYIVNTVSSNGKHRISSVATYRKSEVSGGGNVYRYGETVEYNEKELSSLIDYALKVTDAIGITYGPVHGEYKVDENGPVLIEVNCRPMGAAMPADYLDAIYGHHETDLALESYLYPEKFDYQSIGLACKAKGYLKYVTLMSDMHIVASPVSSLVKHLKSYYTSHINKFPEYDFLPRTTDLATSPGTVFLLSRDNETSKADCELLCRIEEECMPLLYQTKEDFEIFIAEHRENDYRIVISEAMPYGETLFIKNKDDKTANSFDNAVFDFVPNKLFRSFDLLLDFFFDVAKCISIGKCIIITENTYSCLKNGCECFKALLVIADFEIISDKSGIIVAVKK